MTKPTCTIEGCDTPCLCKGLCRKHYTRRLRHGDPLVVKQSRDHGPTCTIDGCTSPYRCKGLCSKHYQRLLAHGDPLLVMMMVATPMLEPSQPATKTVTEA